MARLAILVPPPYFPLTRHHGVFAARSSWRKLVTPKPPVSTASPEENKPCREDPPAPPAPATKSSPSSAPSVVPAVLGGTDDPTSITVKHWGRLLDGALFATQSSRVTAHVDAFRGYYTELASSLGVDRPCGATRGP